MKNFAIALALGIALLGIAIAAIKLNLLPRPTIEIRNDNGRFVMHQHSQFRGDLFMIDTRTGRVWQYVKVTDDKEHSEQFFPVPYHVAPGTVSMRPPVTRSLQELERQSTYEGFPSNDVVPPASKESK